MSLRQTCRLAREWLNDGRVQTIVGSCDEGVPARILRRLALFTSDICFKEGIQQCSLLPPCWVVQEEIELKPARGFERSQNFRAPSFPECSAQSLSNCLLSWLIGWCCVVGWAAKAQLLKAGCLYRVTAKVIR
jgi:hypothetical protein